MLGERRKKLSNIKGRDLASDQKICRLTNECSPQDIDEHLIQQRKTSVILAAHRLLARLFLEHVPKPQQGRHHLH
jgi:hypothetical protein